MGCNNNYMYESDAETLFSVGRRFLNGDCVEKDIAKAKEILGKAAMMGHPLAIKLLESIKEADALAAEEDDMTEWNKMRSGEIYDWTDPVIDRSLKRSRLACERFNKLGMDHEGYREALADMIPGVPDSVTILPPFHCDHGNGLHLGEGVFVNYNAMFLDAANITIGSRTLIGPNCSLYTPQHPINYEQRRKTIESAFPITIGEDCWLGGNVTVCPGVTIGDRTVIGAGSVVTHNIPSDCMAAGNPCKVIKSLA
ncbi:MAG: DapH/DapD/GlmU-related protein [Muribaculaceae bacterium]